MGGAIIVVICIIASIVWGFRAGKKRGDPMTLLTEQLGLTFIHERNYKLANQFPFIDTFRQGANQYTCNILNGTYQNHEITAFDFHYETYSSNAQDRRKTHHHYFSFLILTLPNTCPELTIANTPFFSQIAQTIESENIEIESAEFSKIFTVRAQDPKFASDFCNTRMIDYLLGHPNLTIQVDQNRLAIIHDHCLKVEELESHLQQLVEIRSLMPDHFFEK